MPLAENPSERGLGASAHGKERRKRVLSGMRPTGRLHIGNYFGALANWVKLQDDPSNDCFFFIADWHSLTSDYADTSAIAQNTIEVAIDFLASGLDPNKSTIFQQSQIPDHAELHLLLSMITPLGWLERVPTYKEALENIKDKDLHTYGFLGYPVLQAGDIVMYGEPVADLLVPVGEDQVSHVELTREIVRRFNLAYGKLNISSLQNELALPGLLTASGIGSKVGPAMYSDTLSYSEKLALVVDAFGKSDLSLRGSYLSNGLGWMSEVLVEPDVMLTETPRVPGTDGRKMSKSYGNLIELGESDESIRAKTKVMMTDPARKRRTDKGNPDVCPVYDWHKLFSPPDVLAWSNQGCRTAGIGCIECKAAMADNLIRWIDPIRERRQKFGQHPDEVLQILDEGSRKAREVAGETMRRVREAVFGWEKKRAEISGTSAATTNAKAGD